MPGIINQPFDTMKNSAVYLYFVAFALLTALCGLIYIVGQQNLRLGANDPQIQIAQDLSDRLSHGVSMETVVPNQVIDVARSLSPFIIIFDQNGNPMVSQALLDGKVPVPPLGVFQFVSARGEDRFTWQPRNGVRMATVVTRFSGVNSGFVLTARSLREVEIREDQLLRLVFIGWAAMMIFLTVSLFFVRKLHSTRPRV